MTESTESVESVESEEMWRREADAAISDIRKHVRSAALCDAAGGRPQRVCVALTTLEGRQYRVQLSPAGWQVLAARDEPAAHAATAPPAYETLYALLNTISQKYRESFGGELMNKLLDLANKTEG